MQRKQFLKVIGLSVFAVSAAGFTKLAANGQTTGTSPTTSDMLGPYFREGAPITNDLSYPKMKGEPLKVVGQLFQADGKTTIPNKIIEVWHCDHRKKYDNKSKEFRCRAKVKTDANGNYYYTTMIPPNYHWRPKHIHYLVRNIENHKELITQLYFEGDKRINKKTEPTHFPYDEKRILTPYKNEENITEVRLDLILTAL